MGEQTDENEEKAYLSTKLKNVLELDGNPIAVSITSDKPQGFEKWQRRVTLCMLIQSARRGLSLYCPGENIICNGKVHVGIGNSPSWDLEDFLVRREKIVSSKTAARRMLDLARVHSSELKKYIILSPLMKANFHPDVVVFVGTPLHISRILFLDAFRTGEINTLHREPLCSGVIATPIATGKIGVSFLDMSCRAFGQYKPEEMAIGVPYHRVSKIVENINHSIAGTAKSSFLLRLLPRIMNSSGSRGHTS
jgi:uncharacterized protein (DUF169 family)